MNADLPVAGQAPGPRPRPLLRLLLAAALACPALAGAGPTDSPEGLWRIYNDDTGKPQALVRIVQSGDEYEGIIVDTLVPGEVLDDLCVHCTGSRKNQPIKGMVFITGLHRDGDDFVDGRVLDPDTGDTYRCEMHLKDGGRKLVMRGFFLLPMLGRSQTWDRVE
jgi:uncharacterized protein (DUF2147 family)